MTFFLSRSGQSFLCLALLSTQISTPSFASQALEGMFPKFESAVAQTGCAIPVEQGRQVCFRSQQAAESSAAAALAGSTGGAGNDTSIVDAAGAGSCWAQVGFSVASRGALVCREAYQVCMKACTKTQKVLVEKATNASDPQVPMYLADLNKMTSIEKLCAPFRDRAFTHYTDAGGKSLDKNQFDQVFNAAASDNPAESAKCFVKENKTALGWGAVAVGGGALLYKMNKSRKEDEKAAEANAPLNCRSDVGPTKSKCDDYMKKECSRGLSSARCEQFVNRYCGLSGASGGVAEATPGITDEVCKNAVAHMYCKADSKRADCFTCRDLATRSAGRCPEGSETCGVQLRSEDIAAYKKACPDDPVFSNPLLAGRLPGAQGPGSGGSKTGGGGGSVGGGAGDPVKRAGTDPGGATGGGIIPSQSRNVASGNLPPDVSGPGGGSLFSHIAETIRKECEAGMLQNCQLKSGVN